MVGDEFAISVLLTHAENVTVTVLIGWNTQV